MKMPLKKNTKECFLALDVGTEAVKALVFEKENKKYYILGSALEYFDELRPFDRDKVISKVKDEAIVMAGVAPKGLFLGLSPDILRSRVDFQAVHRKNPKEIIDKKEEEDLRQHVFRETEKKVAENFAKVSGILPQELHFVSFEILEIKIDGYEIPHLSGYSGKNLGFRVLANFLPKDYFNNFLRVAENAGLMIKKIVNPIKNLPEILKVSEGAFVDIGGDVTQICLVRDNRIDSIGEFRIGGKDFSRAISEVLGMRYLDAKILKEKYSRGELSEESSKRIKEMFGPACREWSLALKSELKMAKGFMPSNFFLFGGGSLLPEIEELIGNKEMKLIYPGDFKDIFDNTHSLDSPQFINSVSLIYG